MGNFTFISLFAGVGGLDLGLERAGLRCVGQVEIDTYCRQILSRHWSNVPRFEDVKLFGRKNVHGQVHIVAGGFPCQDISNAGSKEGIGGRRSGLWKEMLRVIRAFAPPVALIENVAVLRSRGLDVVLRDLAASGYDAEWDCLPAAAVGAPHLRDRLFIVAHARRLRWNGPSIFASIHPDKSGAWASDEDGRLVKIAGRAYRRYPQRLRMEHGIPRPVDRIRGCGNAVVPQVGEWIGRRIVTFLNQVVPVSRSRSLRQVQARPASSRIQRAPSPSSHRARRRRSYRLKTHRPLRR